MAVGFDGDGRQSLAVIDTPTSLTMRQLQVDGHIETQACGTFLGIHIGNLRYRQ